MIRRMASFVPSYVTSASAISSSNLIMSVFATFHIYVCHNHKDAWADTVSKICVFFFLRYITAHLPGKYTATVIIEAYHLEAISHHSAPNWTVCLLHFHFPLSTLSASMWDRPEKWQSLRLIEHPQAQTKLTEPHTGATHGCLDSLLLLCLLVKERGRQKEGQKEGAFGWHWLGRESFYVGCQGHFATWWQKKQTK